MPGMARTPTTTVEEIKERIAFNLSEHRVPAGPGRIGGVTIELRKAVTRTFRAHWTGFKILFPESILLLRAHLNDGRFWAEGYISRLRPSWVLAFRKDPPKVRGTGTARPDDVLAHPHAVEVAWSQRRRLVDAGVIPQEELIRMEDFDDPIEAVDEFFNYTSFYVLKAIDASWSDLGYSPDPSVGWDRDQEVVASLPMEAAIDESLKKSDILWITPEGDSRPLPCWFVYRDGKAYVLSGERQQVIPRAARVRNAKVVTRWKGRDARMAEFDAYVRPITAADAGEFDELAEALLAKRQSVTGTPEENLERLRRECVILELTPRS